MDLAGSRSAALPGLTTDPELVLTWGPLILLPDEQTPWMQQTIRQDVKESGQLWMGRREDSRTHTGWPLCVLDAQVLGADGQVLEHRLGAFYAFFEHGAAALLRTPSLKHYQECRDEIIEIFRSGAPDWSGYVSSVAQIFDLEAGQKGVEHLSRTSSASE